MTLNLKSNAMQAAQNAYAPYSRLKVGAALLSKTARLCRLQCRERFVPGRFVCRARRDSPLRFSPKENLLN